MKKKCIIFSNNRTSVKLFCRLLNLWPAYSSVNVFILLKLQSKSFNGQNLFLTIVHIHLDFSPNGWHDFPLLKARYKRNEILSPFLIKGGKGDEAGVGGMRWVGINNQHLERYHEFLLIKIVFRVSVLTLNTITVNLVCQRSPTFYHQYSCPLCPMVDRNSHEEP